MLFALPSYQFPYTVMNRCLYLMAVQVERPCEFMGKGLDFVLDLWKLHNMPGQKLQFLCFIG
jgi:hypothetical protein